MTNAAKNLMVRVISKRMANGESFDMIILDYPKLTQEEIQMLKDALGIKDGE